MAYDLIVVGGGITGATLAFRVASWGLRVLVVERETKFHDRIRGEALQPWGVAEARKLGIADALQGTVNKLLHFEQILDGEHAFRRDLTATTTVAEPMWGFFHPDAQEILLAYAAAWGAEVRRGATLQSILPGRRPRVTIETDGQEREFEARLVALCGGRNPATRAELGFQVRRDAMPLLLSGVRVSALSLHVDRSVAYVANDTRNGTVAALFPQPGEYARAYFGYYPDHCPRVQGNNDFPRFRELFARTAGKSLPFADVKAAGPLASFECADTWVDHPYRDGVALVGDAAASSDPCWGQGLSLSFHDVRILAEELMATPDWDIAAKHYAERHDRDYGTIRQVAGWFHDLFQGLGPEAAARRARALPLLAQDPTRAPDTLFSGPDWPLEANALARFYGEEAQPAKIQS